MGQGMIKTMRTTAFRVSGSLLGSVWIYESDEIRAAWKKLCSDFRYWPPYSSLETALRVLTEGFVTLNRRYGDTQRAFLISDREIPGSQLERVTRAWEVFALGRDERPLSAHVGGVKPRRIELVDLFEIGANDCFRSKIRDGWVWDAARWEIVKRLHGTKLKTDVRELRLRYHSEGHLYTWDQLLAPKAGGAWAMHRLTPSLMTIPGVHDLVLSVESSLMRLDPKWREAWKRSRWLEVDFSPSSPLLRARAERSRRVEQTEEARWDWRDHAVEVLRGASLNPMPSTDTEGPIPQSRIRAGFPTQERQLALGAGVGALFHECVAHHVRTTLGDAARNVELRTVKVGFPTRDTFVKQSPLSRSSSSLHLYVFLVYADTTTKERIVKALAHVLTESGGQSESGESPAEFGERLLASPDGEVLSFGSISVQPISPPDSDQFLLGQARCGSITEWLSRWLPSNEVGEDRVYAAFVETASLREVETHSRDLKSRLRRAFARRGIVTQFITKASKPRRKKKEFNDHAAANAVLDLTRSAGFFLHPFPAVEPCSGDLVVGVFCLRASREKQTRYMANLVAVEAGSRRSWGYEPSSGWVPLHQATSSLLASGGSRHDEDRKMRDLVRRAVEQIPLRFGGMRAVLMFDCEGARRLWPALGDTSSAELPGWMTRDGQNAVLRVRSQKGEVPRIAGQHAWSEDLVPARHTSFRALRLGQSEGRSPRYVTFGSQTMKRNTASQVQSRFAVDDEKLAEAWQALGLTEIVVFSAGPWSEDDLLNQAALLCRISPTWKRALKRPAPVHLASAVIEDYPFELS